MPFTQAHDFTVEQSTFLEIHGDNYNGTIRSGERGMDILRKNACPDAFHNSKTRYPPPLCSPSTREAVLSEIFDWLATGKERIMWLSGPAGAGKSAIAQTVSEVCASGGTLAGTFFFFRAASGRNTTEIFIASIVYQLAISIPALRAKIEAMVENDPLVFDMSLQVQINTLLRPLFPTTILTDTTTANLSSQPKPPFLIVIDGLDECAGDINQHDLVKQFSMLVNAENVFLRCFITSRPELQIEEAFQSLPWPTYSVSLSDDDRIRQAKDDIRRYLCEGFDQICRKRPEALSSEAKPWPNNILIEFLVHKSSGIFIYASTVLRYIDDEDHHPVDRLQEIIDVPRGSKPFAELDLLYQHIMSTCSEKQLLIRILTVRFLSRRVFYGWEIEFLLGLRRGTVAMVLRRLRSILRVEKSSLITVLHASFEDFILDNERAGLYSITEEGHMIISQILLQFLTRSAQMIITQDTKRIYKYALEYWPSHCKRAGTCDKNPHLVDELSKAIEAWSLHRQRWTSQDDLEGWGTEMGMEWLQIEDSKAAQCTLNPLDVQYRLFKLYFYQEMKDHAKDIRIFTFYEDSPCIYILLGDSSRWIGGHWYSKLLPVTKNTTATLPRLCRVHLDLETYPDFSTNPGKPTIIDRLTTRLIQDDKNINTVDGHINTVLMCLAIFVDGYAGNSTEPWQYSYARKHWTKHLSRIPHGKFEVFEAIQRVGVNALWHYPTREEITIVGNWVKSSGIILKQKRLLEQVAAECMINAERFRIRPTT